MRNFRIAGLPGAVSVGALALALLASTTNAMGASPPTTPRIGKQLAELKGSGAVAGDGFGFSVAISGTTAVVSDGATDGCRPGLGVRQDGRRLGRRSQS